MLKIIITSKLLWLSDLFWEQNAARQRRTRLKTRAIVTWAGFSFIKCRKRIKWKRFLKSSTDRGITLTLTMNISTSIKTHGLKMTELRFRMFLEGKRGVGGWFSHQTPVMCRDRKLTDAKAIILGKRVWEYFKEEDLIYSVWLSNRRKNRHMHHFQMKH